MISDRDQLLMTSRSPSTFLSDRGKPYFPARPFPKLMKFEMVKLDPLVELTRNDPTCINEISLSVWPVPVMNRVFCNESAMHKNVNVKKSFLSRLLHTC